MHRRYKDDPEYRDLFFTTIKCKNCNKLAKKYRANANSFCSTKCRWEYIKKHNPIRYKAMCIGGNLLMGMGKLNSLEVLIKKYINTNCKYCGKKLTLSNIGLDHKIPYYGNNHKNNVQKRRILDRITNLQLICRTCNFIKGNMSDIQYDTLLQFLNSDLDLKSKILKRLKHSSVIPQQQVICSENSLQ